MATQADRIRRARRAAGLTQMQFAKKLHVARSAISHWEREGGTNPSTTRLCSVVAITGIRLEWLLTGAGAMYEQAQLTNEDFKDSRVFVNDVEMRLLVSFRAMRAAGRAGLIKLLGEFPGRGITRRAQ